MDILINNAGIVTEKRFQWSLLYVYSKYSLKLEKNHGHIVTIASLAGISGQASMCDYSASKFAANLPSTNRYVLN